jgi:cytochrome c556
MNSIKKIIPFMLAGMIALSCSKDNRLQFCEGVDNDGNGVKCGKKFTTGDITGVVNSRKPFDAENIVFKIIHIEKVSKITEKTISIKVEREKNKANTALSFYNDGIYNVEVYKQDNLIAEESIEIVDTL